MSRNETKKGHRSRLCRSRGNKNEKAEGDQNGSKPSTTSEEANDQAIRVEGADVALQSGVKTPPAAVIRRRREARTAHGSGSGWSIPRLFQKSCHGRNTQAASPACGRIRFADANRRHV